MHAQKARHSSWRRRQGVIAAQALFCAACFALFACQEEGVIDPPAIGTDSGPVAKDAHVGTTTTASVAYADGGIRFVDGGEMHIDGGIRFVDGGVVYVDGGVVVTDGGIVSIDGGSITIDGGVITIDGGVVTTDGGTVINDGGVVTIDGGVVVSDSGVVIADSGVIMDTGVIMADDAGFVDTGSIDTGVVATDTGPTPECMVGTDCNDNNPCTLNQCSGGVCQHPRDLSRPYCIPCTSSTDCRGLTGWCEPGFSFPGAREAAALHVPVACDLALGMCRIVEVACSTTSCMTTTSTMTVACGACTALGNAECGSTTAACLPPLGECYEPVGGCTRFAATVQSGASLQGYDLQGNLQSTEVATGQVQLLPEGWCSATTTGSGQCHTRHGTSLWAPRAHTMGLNLCEVNQSP